ncbi:MAG: IclR family transcriptional regulator [Candidimonas sp.]|nr:MAG: IclR family transcriptional regulator [Candidimonas sp.]TAM21631.1 MAG: IclR family transcriptional regulator [Candidimonas sp.]TAM79963.1 MAG: IclR family transcriptional regulator [Candidimonas sp.]
MSAVSKLNNEVVGAQVIKRASQLLREIASRNDQGVRLVDIYKSVGLGQSTAHRLLKALAVEGFVLQDEGSKRYRLGPLIFEFGLAIKSKFDLRAAAQDAMERIAAFTEDTVYLVVRSRYESVCIDRIEGNYPVKVLSLDIGGRRPLGTNASGLSILRSLPPAQVEKIIAYNETAYSRFANFSASRVYKELAASNTRGYVSVTVAAGTSAVGLPICGPDRLPLAAIAVAAVESRMSPGRQTEIVDFMRKEIAKLEAAISVS